METDIVYIDIGANRGVIPGQEFWVYRPDQIIYRYGSVTDEIGRIYNTQARARVVCVQDESAIIELIRSCSDVEVGDFLLPFEPLPIPLVRRTRPITSCEPPNGKTLGHIIEVKERAGGLIRSSEIFVRRVLRWMPSDFAARPILPEAFVTAAATYFFSNSFLAASRGTPFDTSSSMIL